MGGELKLESEEAKGSVFSFVIPFEKSKTDIENNNEQLFSEKILSKSAKILVAEDNPTNQKLIKSFLNKLGLESEIASDGKECFDLFKEKPFDLILMDCQMPVTDGYEATALIRNYEKEQNLDAIPILALTANAFESDREKCLSAGMITKPVKMNDLTAKLNRYLKTNNDIVTEEKPLSNNEKTVNKEKIVSVLMAEFGLGKEDIEDLVNTFIKDFNEQKDKLKTYWDEQNYPQINEIAHSIAGAAANLRIDSISVPARELNNLLKSKTDYDENDLAKAKECLDKILSAEIS